MANKTGALEYAYKELERLAQKMMSNKEAFTRFYQDLKKDKGLTLEGKRQRLDSEYAAFYERHDKLRKEYAETVDRNYSDLRDLAIGVKSDSERAAVQRVMAIGSRDELNNLVQVSGATNDSVLKKALATRGFVTQDWKLYSEMAGDLATSNPDAGALLEFEQGFGRLATNQRKMEMSMFTALPSKPAITE